MTSKPIPTAYSLFANRHSVTYRYSFHSQLVIESSTIKKGPRPLTQPYTIQISHTGPIWACLTNVNRIRPRQTLDEGKVSASSDVCNGPMAKFPHGKGFNDHQQATITVITPREYTFIRCRVECSFRNYCRRGNRSWVIARAFRISRVPLSTDCVRWNRKLPGNYCLSETSRWVFPLFPRYVLIYEPRRGDG